MRSQKVSVLIAKGTLPEDGIVLTVVVLGVIGERVKPISYVSSLPENAQLTTRPKRNSKP